MYSRKPGTASKAPVDHRSVLIGFVAVLLFGWFCYQPAIGGAFQFDDYFNLRGLAEIDDGASAFEFIFSGITGPTGRPLALASFALQADSWEKGASAFLRVNILIHIFNGALLALCLYQLSRHRAIGRNEAAIIAASAAGLWILMPLIATASLFVVQRMTTLSAFFMLLGLNGYLFARDKLDASPRPALIGMSAMLVISTGLAMLSKESGVLLPVFVLVLEATVLQRPDSVPTRNWRVWQSVFLLLPLILLLVYLSSWLDYSDEIVARRGFTAWERLLTEARVLWIYLAKALLGIPSQIGIYQDPPAVSRSLLSASTSLAVIAWLALFTASLAWRRRYPLFAVAVIWYLAGHLVESTVVPLELYFEHRNYMPIIGPVFATISFLVLHTGQHRRIGLTLIALAGLFNAWSLYGFASLSGQPSLAARYWAATYPDSQRAISRLATFQLLEEGPLHAISTIDTFATANPQHAYMRIAQLNLLCKAAPGYDHSELVEQTRRDLPEAEFSHISAIMLFELYGTVSSAKCNSVDVEMVTSLATILRDNPRYKEEALYNQAYQKILAALARQRGDYGTVVEHLREAITYWPGTDLNRMMVEALLRDENFAAAHEFIDEAESLAPSHPVKAVMWRQDLDNLRAYVHDLEQKAGTQDRALPAQGFDTHE